MCLIVVRCLHSIHCKLHNPTLDGLRVSNLHAGGGDTSQQVVGVGTSAPRTSNSHGFCGTACGQQRGENGTKRGVHSRRTMASACKRARNTHAHVIKTAQCAILYYDIFTIVIVEVPVGGQRYSSTWGWQSSVNHVVNMGGVGGGGLGLGDGARRRAQAS